MSLPPGEWGWHDEQTSHQEIFEVRAWAWESATIAKDVHNRASKYAAHWILVAVYSTATATSSPRRRAQAPRIRPSTRAASGICTSSHPCPPPPAISHLSYTLRATHPLLKGHAGQFCELQLGSFSACIYDLPRADSLFTACSHSIRGAHGRQARLSSPLQHVHKSNRSWGFGISSKLHSASCGTGRRAPSDRSGATLKLASG